MAKRNREQAVKDKAALKLEKKYAAAKERQAKAHEEMYGHLRGPDDPIRGPEETIQASEETIRAPEETIRAPEETIQAPEETVQAPEGTEQP